jgi:hypothetical protein
MTTNFSPPESVARRGVMNPLSGYTTSTTRGDQRGERSVRVELGGDLSEGCPAVAGLGASSSK